MDVGSLVYGSPGFRVRVSTRVKEELRLGLPGLEVRVRVLG